MEYKNIRKDIYHLPDIQRRLRKQIWALCCIGIGAIGVSLMLFADISEAASSIVLGMISIGAFALVSMSLFYLFGDSKVPYYKPQHKALQSTEVFYDKNVKDSLVEAVNSHNLTAVAATKKCASPNIVLVRYSDDDDKIIYSQVFESIDGKLNPITDIVFDEVK